MIAEDEEYNEMDAEEESSPVVSNLISHSMKERPSTGRLRYDEDFGME